MAYSYNKYTGTGALQMLAVPAYIDREHIKVSIDNVDTTSFEWVNDSTIKLTAPLNALVKVYRNSSPQARVTDYIDGVPLTEAALDNDSLQAFYLAQEQLDSTQDALEVVGQPNFTAIVDNIALNAANAEAAAEATAATLVDFNAAVDQAAIDAAAQLAALNTAADQAVVDLTAVGEQAVTDVTAAAAAAVAASGDGFVPRTSPTGAAGIPAGSTAERPAVPQPGDFRLNETLNEFEGYNGSEWGSVGGGATGAPGNKVFHLNDQVVTGDFTIPVGKNAVTAGPISIASGVTVTISPGSTWSIV